MPKDDFQFYMLLAFTIILILGLYKLYILFKTPSVGLDTKTQHMLLQDIIIKFLSSHDNTESSAKDLFTLIQNLDAMQDEAYKNFNLNRFNQLLQQLFYTYEVDCLPDLIKAIQKKK